MRRPPLSRLSAMMKSAVMAAALLLPIASPVKALECTFCQGKDLTRLVALSVSMESPSLRAQIRGWLAETHPETAAGYLGRAWIASANGADKDTVVALYLEAIRRDPDIPVAHINAAYELDDADRPAEAVALLREVVAERDDEPSFVRNIYFYTKDSLKDPAGAEAFLREASANGYGPGWTVDYVRGIAAQSAGDRTKADEYYTRALKNGGSFEVLDRQVRNKLRVLAAERASRQARFDVLIAAINWGRNTQSAPALFLVAEILADDFKAYSDAFSLFRESYQMGPTPEAAASGFGAIGNDRFQEGLDFLTMALGDFPDNHELLRTMVWALSNFDLDAENARYYGQLAIENSPRNSDVYESVRQYVSFLEEVADWDASGPIYETQLPKMSGRDYNNMLGDYLDNRIRAGDLDHASRLLAEAKSRSGFSTSWLAVRESRLTRALRLSNQSDRYFAENPFLVDWENRFGDSLRVTVEFATGKADIQPSAFPVLDQAAQALKSPGADDYVFLIEGHTDSTGTDTINMPLSKARAASVRQYMLDRHGLDPARVQTVGYGPRVPLATNQSDEGKQINRRVEIRPYGNIAAPRIATNGWLDTRSLRLSRDGRIAVTGYSPIQVWDLERMVRIHQLPIGSSTREIAPNGRYLAARSAFTDPTGTTTNMMYIYDLRTGLVHAQLPVSDFIDEISWSPFSDAVAWTERGGFLRVYDVKAKAYRAVNRVDTIRGSEEMVWMNSGKNIVAKAPRRSTMQVFDATTLELVEQIPTSDWIHSLTQTFDGKYLVAITNDYELVVWDSATWQEISRRRMPISSFDLQPHPSQPWVMIADGFDNDTKLAMVDITTGQIIVSRRDDASLRGGFTPDGVFFVTVFEDEIAYLDTETLEVSKRLGGQSVAGKDLAVVANSDLIVSRDETGSSVWSLKTGRLVHRINRETVGDWQPLSADGTVLVNADTDGRLITFDTRSFVDAVAVETGLNIYKIAGSAGYIAIASVPEGDGPFQSPQSQVIVYDRDGLREITRQSFDIVSEPTNFDDIYRPRVYLSVADNGLVSISSAWTAGFKQGSTNGQIVTVYDATGDREVTTFRAEGRYENMKWENGGNELWVKDSVRWYVHDPRNGRVLRRETPEADYKIEMSDGRSLRWFWDHVALDGKEVFFPYTLRDIEVHEERNLAIGQTTGNEIVFIDLANMAHALTIAPKADGEWIAYAPDGGYSASLNGTRGVYWSLGDNYVPFSALAEQFERPGLIRNMLEAIARGDAREDVTPDVKADVFEAPYTVALLTPATLTTDQDNFVLELSVEKASADLADPEIEYVLNGRRVLKSRGFEEEAFFDGNETLGITRRFDLNPGTNVIEASLVWRDARIQTQRVEVTREGGDEAPKERVAGKTLWFFGVGVSDYEKSSQNLNFAHRDVEELAKLMQAQEGGLFDRVETRIITNDAATERNVRIQMNEFLDQSAPEDVIVMFLAGHGVTDEEQSLYFMTHEADLSKPYTGMGVDRFRQYLENRPINQNALFLLDICHSGAAEGRVVAEDAVQSLTKGTGAVVFASSSGSGLSYEDESFGGGHGAFTAALLEGLRGLADNRVGNRDGLNSLQEMVLFTSSRVPELTQGQQRPQIPALALDVDYPLSVASN